MSGLTSKAIERPGLIDRLWAKISRCEPTPENPDPCWEWQGAKSKSGRRKVQYGIIRRGKKRDSPLRAHRLVLLLTTAGDEPGLEELEGESPEEWLTRAIRFYKGLEAAHQCDNSICCKPAHLRWESHQENLSRQREREHQARLVARAAEEIEYANSRNSVAAEV